jgi:hypothetical protein
VTNLPGLALGVKTADCLPILCYDPKLKVIAAVHAGWRGSVSGILEKIIEKMNRHFGCTAQDLLLAFGPCIRTCCYKVGAEVKEKAKSDLSGVNAVIEMENKELRFDLVGANRAIAIEAGVIPSNIDDSACLCTCCHPELFFSYRRDGETGRHVGVIMLKT